MQRFEESLTLQEILKRFKKHFGRDITLEESRCFLLTHDSPPDLTPDDRSDRHFFALCHCFQQQHTI
jgi:hypothetical protein